MSGTVILIIALVVIVLFLPSILGGGHSSSANRVGSRRNREEADRLIGQAEMQVQTGQLDSAESNYSRATVLAAGDPLLLSEAHYGLCRVCERRGDLKGAARQVDAALAYAPQWRQYKPNFESLLTREKARILGAIGKNL